MNEPEGCFSIFWLIDILTAKNDFEKLNFEKFKVPREININSKNTIVSFQFAWYLLYWKKNVFPSQILHNPTDNKYYRRCNGLFSHKFHFWLFNRNDLQAMDIKPKIISKDLFNRI